MKTRSIGFIVGSASSLLALAGLCLADDTWMMGVGGTVKAMKGHASIVMVSERVNVRIEGNEARAECTFVFENTGPCWSPDGTRLALAFDWGISVVNADGSNRRQLSANTDGQEAQPSWTAR